MINSTGHQPVPPSGPTARLPGLADHGPSTSDSPMPPFAGKCVAIASGGSEPIEPASSTSAIAISARSVESGFASDPLPAKQPGDFVKWGELDQQIRESLTFLNVYVFAIYLGLPLNQLFILEQKFPNRNDATRPFHLLEDFLTQANHQLTYEQWLIVLANTSRPELAKLYCEKSGVAIDQSQFLSDWPACVQAADNDAALNHKLDIFKLIKILQIEKGRFFNSIPTTTLAYAAGYPELMDDQDIKQFSEVENFYANIFLFKKILDKHGGSITTNEIVKIMCNPEIMLISCAYRLIESLKGNTIPFFLSYNSSWNQQLVDLAYQASELGINAEHLGRALGVPLHIIQKIVDRNYNSVSIVKKFDDLFYQAILCSPRLTPGHIIHAMREAGRASGCHEELEKWIEIEKAHLSRLNEFPSEELPELKPLYWPENDHPARIVRSQPLTLDFLRHLPLSHNWFLIGLTMGLSGDELERIGSITILKNGAPDQDELSLTALELSRTLVQKGLETGHLYQALKMLDDQATLAYFPEHSDDQPEKKLPGKIAKAIRQGQLMARVVPYFGSESIKFLNAMMSTVATSRITFKSLKRPLPDNPATELLPPELVKTEPAIAIASNVAPMLERSVISGTECSRLPETPMDGTVYWSSLGHKFTRGISPDDQVLFAIYLGFPIADIAKISETVMNQEYAPANYLALPVVNRQDKATIEKLMITHKKLLTMLAGISRFDLVELHCKKFGIVFDQSRLTTQSPPTLETVDANAELDYQLDFFTLHQIVNKDEYLVSTVPKATIAFAAGYPELMMDQDLQSIPNSVKQFSTMILLNRILEKQGGIMTTNELVKIMSHPEIMNIRCVHRFIESLREHPVPFSLEDEGNLCRQMLCLAGGIAKIKIPADVIGNALGVSLPIIQRILNESFVDEADHDQIYELLLAATRCQPGLLTPAHILCALREAAGPKLEGKLNRYMAINSKKLSLFLEPGSEQPPVIKPLYRQDDDSSVTTTSSLPLTPDFLRRLPLSHNWFLIGLAMGLPVDELREMDLKTRDKNNEVEQAKQSIAACYLSHKLAELGKRGVETGHLFRVLHNLDDQMALHYFPEHLSAQPEKTLPEDIANAMEQAKLILRLLNTVDLKELKKILSGYNRYNQMKIEFWI
ncbi:hypothetical protein ACTL6P_09380 [Endozoicomonas acroporae]|uniref:hypothetical protein n=1 Tax=Endozoicomonas acroporae TaxID=1701104 RepID=UPI0011AF2989|nr:hypothetical protein [Endozoicomonas acroporae]